MFSLHIDHNYPYRLVDINDYQTRIHFCHYHPLSIINIHIELDIDLSPEAMVYMPLNHQQGSSNGVFVGACSSLIGQSMTKGAAKYSNVIDHMYIIHLV